MSESIFVTPKEARYFYPEIIPAYQAAFSDEPWNEVSKCADRLQRCEGGLSAVALGQVCDVCKSSPVHPAYEPDELIERFEMVGSARPAAWYIERSTEGLTLAVLGWKASASIIADEKYRDTPAMYSWLNETLAGNEVLWVDEVFANRQKKPKGNLQNFGKFAAGLGGILKTNSAAYRTIEPRMLAAARRDFSNNAAIFTRRQDVPDRRDFVLISLGGER